MDFFLFIAFFTAYCCGFAFVVGFIGLEWEERATLSAFGLTGEESGKKKKGGLFGVLRKFAIINRPLCPEGFRRGITKRLMMARWNISVEEFIFFKQICMLVILIVLFPATPPDMRGLWLILGFSLGYLVPDFILNGKIKKVKYIIVKELPDAIDLLGLCVNAGLDFMLALKWVVEKSQPSVMVDELNTVLQEINVGKTRRDAIRDLAGRYELPDLSTFSRTLIQADKMGTSVTEALNILSEDMRLARYRRGEQLALKAPLKMLIPLLVFIFPVVFVLVAGPVMIDFIQNNPFKSLGGG